MTTSMPKRRANSAAKLRAAWVISLSEPSTLYGSPTTAMSGCQSLSIEAMSSQRGPFRPAGTVSKAEALRLMLSPQATPILRRPKSKARMIFAREDSGISAGGTDSRQFHAQKTSGGMPAGLERQFENQTQVHRRTQPRVRPKLFLQLAAVPAGVPQGDNGLLGPLAARHGRQYVPRRGHVQRIGDLERRIPFAERAMHDEAAIGLHRSTAQYLPLPEGSLAELDLELIEYFPHAHRQGLVEDQSERAVRIVIAHQGDGLREIRITHVRHGDQQLVGQIA